MTGRQARRLAWVAVVAVGAVTAGCSGDSSGDLSGDPSISGAPSTSSVAPPAVPGVPDAPPPGQGVVVVGGTSSPFEVTSCRLEADPSEPAGAQTLVALEGAGTTPRGAAFTVEVQRFATGTDVQTFTDAAAYSDSARILQVQRIEVAGQVTDLRDPDASSALVRVRDDGVSLAGLASAPGDDRDDGGLIGLALNATCG